MRKRDKLKNIEELNKKLLGENLDWADEVESDSKIKTQSPNKFDLSEKENLDEFFYQLVTLWNQYTGHKPSNAAVANDNRVILFNLLMDGGLAKVINQRISPSGLHLGSHGSEYYTNNPDQMEEFLKRIGVTNFQLKHRD
jgi:hypothetical protein